MLQHAQCTDCEKQAADLKAKKNRDLQPHLKRGTGCLWQSCLPALAPAPPALFHSASSCPAAYPDLSILVVSF